MKHYISYVHVRQNMWWVILVLVTIIICVAIWRFFDYKIEHVRNRHHAVHFSQSLNKSDIKTESKTK